MEKIGSKIDLTPEELFEGIQMDDFFDDVTEGFRSVCKNNLNVDGVAPVVQEGLQHAGKALEGL